MSEKKTILIATDNFKPRVDGIACFLEMLIPCLKEYNIIVVAPNFKGKFKKKGEYELQRVPIRKFTVGDYPIPHKPKNLINLVKKADLVFTNTIGPIGKAVINEAHKQEKKIIAFVHSIEWVLVEKSLATLNLTRSILSLITKMLAKNLYNKCTGLIVPSHDIGEIFSVQGIKRPKYIVHLGVDTKRFSPTIKDKAKQAINIDKDDFVVGFVGRIAREKSLLTLKKAFKKIEVKKKKLLIVGEGISSLKRKLKGTNTIITGKTNDVVPFLRAMDVFVMPSLTETTCLAALEAMACEIPIITTKVGNLRSYITHNINGLFFPRKNDTVLSIRLNYLYNNPLKIKDLGKSGRKTVIQDYSWDKTKEKLLKIIKLQIQ